MGVSTTLVETASPQLISAGDSTPRIRPLASPASGLDKAMAASFLQYCAMCEKQIMTPCNSILYCSEACRKKDDIKPLSASILPASYLSASAPTSPYPTTPVQFPRSTYDTTPVLRIPAEPHDHKPDLDPTEWKPKLLHRNHSEAYLYLAKFHAANMNATGSEYVRVERPRFGHKHTVSMTTTPSLSNTPTTVPSSFESIYSFNTRPLNQRTNPMYALSNGAKTTDLVTPHIAPPPDVDLSAPAEGNMTWEKKVVIKDAVKNKDGLGALLSGSK